MGKFHCNRDERNRLIRISWRHHSGNQKPQNRRRTNNTMAKRKYRQHNGQKKKDKRRNNDLHRNST